MAEGSQGGSVFDKKPKTIGEIQAAMTYSLDDAYDGGGSGAGRVIDVDAGPAIFDGTGATSGSVLNVDGPATFPTFFYTARFTGGGFTVAFCEWHNSAPSHQVAIEIPNVPDNISGWIYTALIRSVPTFTMDSAGSRFQGIEMDFSAVVMTSFDASYGIHLTMPDDATPTNNPIYGVFVEMPSGAMSGNDMAAFYGIAYATQIAKLATGPPNYAAAEFTGRVRITDDSWGYGGLYINRAEDNAIEIITNGHSSARAIKMVLDEGMGVEVDWTTNPITTDSRVMDIDMDVATRGNYINVYGIYINIDEVGAGGIDPTINGMYVEYTGYATSPALFKGYEVAINGSGSTEGFYVEFSNTSGSGQGFHAKFSNTSPTAALFKGVYVEGDSATLTDFTVAYGVHVKMPDDPTPRNNPLYGVFVEMPASYSGLGMKAGHFTGNGYSLEILSRHNEPPIQHEGIRISSMPNMTNAEHYRGFNIESSHTVNNAGANFAGYRAYLSGVILTNFQVFYGIHLEMPDDATPTNNPIYGIFVEADATYNGSDMMAAKFTGDGRTVQICNTNYAIETDSWIKIGGEGIIQTVHTDDISNPPTDAELDVIFGTPATVGAGFMALIDDNAGGANFYRVESDGTNWWITSPTKAA